MGCAMLVVGWPNRDTYVTSCPWVLHDASIEGIDGIGIVVSYITTTALLAMLRRVHVPRDSSWGWDRMVGHVSTTGNVALIRKEALV